MKKYFIHESLYSFILFSPLRDTKFKPDYIFQLGGISCASKVWKRCLQDVQVVSEEVSAS